MKRVELVEGDDVQCCGWKVEVSGVVEGSFCIYIRGGAACLQFGSGYLVVN